MQAGMGITDGIIQGKISCFRNKFHKHKEKCSEKRKFLGALCLRSEAIKKSIVKNTIDFSITYTHYNELKSQPPLLGNTLPLHLQSR